MSFLLVVRVDFGFNAVALRDVRQIKSRVDHVRYGFSEPVSKPSGFVLRAVLCWNAHRSIRAARV